MKLRTLTRAALAAALTLACAGAASAQTGTVATPSSKLAWDEVGQACPVAVGATFNVYADGATLPAALANASCGAGPTAADATWNASFPALTPGTHVLVLTEVFSGAESSPSVALTLRFVIVVTPTNVRIVRAGGDDNDE